MLIDPSVHNHVLARPTLRARGWTTLKNEPKLKTTVCDTTLNQTNTCDGRPHQSDIRRLILYYIIILRHVILDHKVLVCSAQWTA